MKQHRKKTPILRETLTDNFFQQIGKYITFKYYTCTNKLKFVDHASSFKGQTFSTIGK